MIMFNFSDTLHLDGKEGNYILSVSDELESIYISLKWISLSKTNIGLLYRDVSRTTGGEWRVLDKNSNEVTIDRNITGELFFEIIFTISFDLGIGKFNGTEGNYTSITLTREDLQKITSNYRVNLTEIENDIFVTVMEITEREIILP